VIQAGANDLLLHVTEFTVILGMFVMLFGLLVPREPETVPTTTTLAGASATLAKMMAMGGATAQEEQPAAVVVNKPPITAVPAVQATAAPEPVQASTFAAIVAEAKRQVEDQDTVSSEQPPVEMVEETDSGFNIDEMLRAPLVNDLATNNDPQPVAAPVDRSALAKRITWPSLVDDQVVNCDLPTRLRLIEALSFIGGSWSIDILARAYEQELDANVRGAIFVALRDARSAA